MDGDLVLVLIIAFVVEGIAYAFYLGWRNVIVGWKTEINRFGTDSSLAAGAFPLPPAQGVTGRELSIKEIVILSFRTYRRYLGSYLGLYLVAGLGFGLLSVAIARFIPYQTFQYSSPLWGLISTPESFLYSLVYTALSSPINAIVDGTGVSIAVGWLSGGRASLRESFSLASGKSWSLISVVLVTGFISDIAGIVPLLGFIPLILFFVVIPVVIIEGRRTLETLSRSRQLVDKRWTMVFEILFIFGLMIIIPVYAIDAFFPLGDPIGTILLSLFTGVSSAFYAVSATAFYYSSVARLSAPPPTTSNPSQVVVRQWVCKNCGTSTVAAFRPGLTAFGGCLKAKRGWLEPTGKHDWEPARMDVRSNQRSHCAYCGKQVGPSDQFCPSCGRALSNAG